MMTAAEQFRDAIRAAGLTPPEKIVPDGALHRFASNGSPNDDAGYYVIHAGDIPHGSFGCFRSGIKRRWRFDIGRPLTEAEQRAHTKAQLEDRKRRQEEREFDRVASAAFADDAWGKAYPAKPDHPYLIAKRIGPHHARQWAGRLVIPLWTGERLESLQYIDERGEKRFLRKARIDGLFSSFGRVVGDSPTVCLAEGFATGATIFEVTGLPTFAAMSANNLPLAAKRIRQLFPGAQIVVCADDDEHKDGRPNIGVQKAGEAARAVNGEVCIPDFGDVRREGDSDFNDLLHRRGSEVVTTIINAAINAFASRRHDLQAAIEQLATLPVIDQEQRRKALAKEFGVRVSIVDEILAAIASSSEKAARKGTGKGRGVGFETLEPWAEPVDGAALLDDITAVIHKYVVLPRHAAAAVALWVVGTYLMDIARIAARLLVTAPEKGCGKTRLVEVADRLVHRALTVSNITSAGLFRSIESYTPCLLVDEFDSFGKDNNDLRNVINSGHTRAAAFVLRTEGDTFEPQLFSTWAPILIAMIGLPKGTILDRSVTIKLQRKTRSETVARLRHGQDTETFTMLRQKIARFAHDQNAALKVAVPATPEQLSDRQQDNWELLLGIADAAGTADTVLNGALDLSAVHDLTAAVFVAGDGSVYPYCWLPEEGLAEKSRLDKVDYVGMVRDGFLLTTPGRAVSYDYVARFLRRIFDDCKIGTIGFDRAYMRFLLPCLVRAGFSESELAKFVEVGQGFLGMSPCIRELEVRLLEKKLKHGMHPVLLMAATNAAVITDDQGNRKFTKKKSVGRIDPLVALAMAVSVIPPETYTPEYRVLVI